MAVYKDKQRGTFYFQAWVTLPAGKKKQIKRRGFKSKRLAMQAELDTIREAETSQQERGVTFGHLAEEFLKWYELRRKESSFRKVRGTLETHLLPRFSEKKLEKIRPRDVTQLQDELISKYSANHVKKIHVVLSQVFNFGIKQEYTTYNPCTVVGNVEMEEEKHMNYWTLEEFRQFTEVVGDFMYYTLFMTLYYSGMRKGEALALTWSDVDAENNIINIDKTAYNREVTRPKTKAAVRRLMMPQQVMRLLTQLKAEKEYVEEGHIVFGEFHDHISTTTLDRKFERYVKESGVKKIRLHDFRHSHASYLINRSTIVSVIASRLGHSDVSTTLNTYSHLYPSTEKEAVLKMEDDFKRAEVINLKGVN